MLKLDYKWLVCQAHTSAENWSTLVLMLQLTPELENAWRKGLTAFAEASRVADIKELQVHAPMRVVELDFTPYPGQEFDIEVIRPLEKDSSWRLLTNTQAQILLDTGKELHLEYGYSHLKVWPGPKPFRIRACTASKNVEDDIYGIEDLHQELRQVFTLHPKLV